MFKRILDLVPQGSNRYAKDRFAALQQYNHLVTVRALVHFLVITYDGDVFQLIDTMLGEKTDGFGYILQINADIQ